MHELLGLQFSSVDIVLPANWEVTSVTVQKARSSHQSDYADIKIQESLEFEEPYTQHILGCGKTALFMNVGHQYLSNPYISKSGRLHETITCLH